MKTTYKAIVLVFIFSSITALLFQNCSEHYFKSQNGNGTTTDGENLSSDESTDSRDIASLSLETSNNKKGYITIKGSGSGKVTWAMSSLFGGYGPTKPPCYTYQKECNMNLGPSSAILKVIPDFGSKISTDPNDYTICSGGGGSICTANDTPFVTFIIDPDVKSINNITLSNQGDGAGSIQSSEEKIITARTDNCSIADSTSTCTFAYSAQQPTKIKLTAAASFGSHFESWTGGDCMGSTEPTCTVLIDQDKSVSVHFKKDPVFIMTVKKSDDSNGLGSITASYGLTTNDCDKTCGNGSVTFVSRPDPTYVTLLAKAESGSQFDSWVSGDCVGTNPSCTFAMNQNRSAIAKFVKIPTIDYSVTLSRTGEGVGSIDASTSIPFLTLSSLGINASSITSAFSLDSAQEVNIKLKAIPASGSSFVGWTGGASNCGTNLDCTVKISSSSPAAVATAQFSKIPVYTIAVNKEGTGRGSVSSVVKPSWAIESCTVDTQKCNFTSKQKSPSAIMELTAIPESSTSVFVGWKKGSGLTACNKTAKGSSTTLCNLTVNKNQTVTAIFNKKPGGKINGLLYNFTLAPIKSATVNIAVPNTPSGAITLGGFFKPKLETPKPPPLTNPSMKSFGESLAAAATSSITTTVKSETDSNAVTVVQTPPEALAAKPAPIGILESVNPATIAPTNAVVPTIAQQIATTCPGSDKSKPLVILSPNGKNKCTFTWPSAKPSETITGEAVGTTAHSSAHIYGTCNNDGDIKSNNGVWWSSYTFNCPDPDVGSCPGGGGTWKSLSGKSTCHFNWGQKSIGETHPVIKSNWGNGIGEASGTCMKVANGLAAWSFYKVTCNDPDSSVKTCPEGAGVLPSATNPTVLEKNCQFYIGMNAVGTTINLVGTNGGTGTVYCDTDGEYKFKGAAICP